MPDLEILQKLLIHLSQISHVTLQLFSGETLIFCTADQNVCSEYIPENPFLCDNGLYHILHSDFDKEWTFKMDEEEPMIYYGLYHCGELLTCIAGPVAAQTLSTPQIRGYMKRHNMHDFQNYYIRTCSISELTSIFSILSFELNGTFFEAEMTNQNLLLSDETSVSKEDFEIYRMLSVEQPDPHFPYRMEQELMTCIREANLDGLKKLDFSIPGYHTGTISLISSKSQEYSAVIGVSLFSRAAIEGGMNPYDAYDLNDLYLQRISLAHSDQERSAIFFEALNGYIRAVKKSKKLANNSVHVQKCRQFIIRHLNQHFTLRDLAEEVGLTPTYLSKLFSETEHMTIKEYTLRERVYASENMLKYSDYSISQIAEYLCFHSQSHFGAVFKRINGKTPSLYRQLNKVQGF